MVLEYTAYLYKSEYTSVSYGYPAVGGMMTQISSDLDEHHLTKAGICKRMVKFSKDTNEKTRGSRHYWYRSTSENAKWRQINRGGPLNWGSDTYQFQTGINKHQAYNTTTNVQQVGSRYVAIFNKWVIMG